jgi:hypothetical protein
VPRRLLCWSALLIASGCAGSGDDGSDAPIEFSNLRVEEVSAYRAVVRFDTSREARCEVRFGLSDDALDASATDPNMAPGTYLTRHEVPLEDLQPDTTYSFTAVATDREDREYTADTGDFSTGPGTPVDSMTNNALASAGTAVVAVSSNWGGGGNDSSFGADNAIDGEMASEWSSDGDGDDAFLEIDLGASREVSVIGFRSRKMTDGTSIVRSFDLLVDGSTVLGPFDTPDPDTRSLIPLDPPVSMQIVRLRAIETTGGNTGVKELQLFSP